MDGKEREKLGWREGWKEGGRKEGKKERCMKERRERRTERRWERGARSRGQTKRHSAAGHGPRSAIDDHHAAASHPLVRVP